MEETPDAHARAAIKAKAMEAVMEGAQPRMRAVRHCVGEPEQRDDTECRDPGTGSFRFIRFKGRCADAGATTITRNEMLAAFNAEEPFIIATAPVDDGFIHRPPCVCDPWRIFGPARGIAKVSWATFVSTIRRNVEAEP